MSGLKLHITVMGIQDISYKTKYFELATNLPTQEDS